MTKNSEPVDAWLMFESDEDEEATHEANTFIEDDRFRVEWSNTSVGQAGFIYCDTYPEVEATLINAGYQKFSG